MSGHTVVRLPEGDLPIKAQGPEMRRPPAYQTYASDDLARETYYGLSLASRGLFDAMLRAIWVNGYVPKEPRLLAKATRSDLDEIHEALVPALIEQFVPLDSDPSRLTHRELERQRAKLDQRRELQRMGGMVGANRRYNRSQSNSGKGMGKPMGSEKSRAEQKRTRSIGRQVSPTTDGATDPWVEEYDEEEKKRPK